MNENTIVSDDEWTRARIELLNEEKELMRKQDQLARRRRSLPWRRVDQRYVFDGPDGKVELGELFAGRGQLIVYHFMFGDGWKAGCSNCSLVTDSLAPSATHLRARDVELVLVSRAPIADLLRFRERMGWELPWVSSAGNDFNRDFHVYPEEPGADGLLYYNYEMMNRYPPGDLPGLSVFRRDEAGDIFHTYSTYARGLETFMTTYSLLDVVPKGRDEADLPWPMAWVRHHDAYDVEKDAGEQ